ncbi:leucine-rich repeat-containing protein kinase family protein [soil metagenome]
MSIDTLTQLRAGNLSGIKRLDLACGLTELPPEIFDLADSLEVLNLTHNQLTDLPDDLARLHKLRILFCSENRFTHVPPVIGFMPHLSMVGFKSNRIETVDAAAMSPSLRWLILTDNRIQQLPASIGRCTSLQKLMLAGNQLEQLPEEMATCVSLEMLRLSANRFHALPEWLLRLPQLTWLALAGNPCSNQTDDTGQAIPEIDWKKIDLMGKIGEGASGFIYKAHWQTADEVKPVAVKVFKGAVTSDGLPASEMAACLAAGTHDNLVGVLGKIIGHPDGASGLVMPLIDPAFRNLAGPPSLDSCTRDIYADDQRFTLPAVLRMALGIATAAGHLHERGILHGDLYAHNVLWSVEGDCLLGDFGAAACYGKHNIFMAHSLQAIEVRAFGCLLEELLARCVVAENERSLRDILWALQERCMVLNVTARPSFADLQRELQRH